MQGVLFCVRFDPATYLDTVAKGRSISTHRKGDKFFAQGEAADAIFYIKKGKVKVTVVSKQGNGSAVRAPLPRVQS
jgi:CRP/FNR family transcriptional regulator, cyclic AMP receptor protein